MGIQVELRDGNCVTVSPEGLDRLLNHHRVKRFQRGSVWASVGIHPIRLTSRCDVMVYDGPERRHA